MFDRLDWHEVLALHPEFKELEDGQQVHVNHPNCPSGADRKGRLFVKRDGVHLIGYCHHCAQSGRWSLGRQSFIRKRAKDRTVHKLRLPNDMRYELSDCHVKANVWFAKYGITMEERRHYGFGWSDNWKRAILPIWQGGEMIAFQARRLLDHDQGPKYLTRKQEGWDRPFFTAGWGEHLDFGTMVVVEDMLSAVKVGRFATATAILNAQLGETTMAGILRYKPNRVLVWLDDDNPAVRESQRKLARRITPYADVTKITGVGADPKELSDEQIVQLLRRAA